MSKKKKILIFIDWFLPGYKAGGPIRSVANMLEHLSDDFSITIVTSDRDLDSNTPYQNIEKDKFIKQNNYSIIYLSPKNQTKKYLKKIIKKQDFNLVYFNSLFSFKFTLLPLFIIKNQKKEIKIILAPRGMLGQSALNLKKFKKQAFLKFSKLFKLFNNIIWHATDKTEVSDIKKYFGENAKIKLISNIPGRVGNYVKREKDITKFVFLSRIAEIKNLLYAIKCFQKLKTDKRVIFSIFGTEEELAYLRKCKTEANLVRQNIQIDFKGELAHEEVNSTLSEYHFYFLPTMHENYGHTIFEAISAGCPVIISDQTPWQNLEEKKIGWDIALNDEEKFVDTIQKCIDMPQSEYDKLSENAFKFAKKYINNSEAIEQTKKMFQE